MEVYKMNYYPYAYSFPPYPVNTPICHCGQPFQADFYTNYREKPYSHQPTIPTNHIGSSRDKGKQPFVINIKEAARCNNTFRTAIWTGDHLQVTLMSIQVGDSIGLEMHPHTDQFLRIEEGEGRVQMGKSEHQLTF